MKSSEPLHLAYSWVIETAFESDCPLVVPTKDHNLAGLFALPAWVDATFQLLTRGDLFSKV